MARIKVFDTTTQSWVYADKSFGRDGESISITNITESDEPNGNNIITFSDGNTLNIKNGNDGVSPSHSWNGTTLSITSASGTSSVNLKGEAGYSPVKGTDYWTDAEQEAMVQQVITALGTPVFGRVDAENNIILTGELADGTYTLKYEDAEGNVTEIGTIEVGGPEYINLADPTSEDWAVGKRLNSSAELVGADGCITTNFFPCVKGNVIRVKGLDIRYTNSEHTQNARAWFFKDNGDPCVGAYPVSDPKIVFDGVDMVTITIDGLDNIGTGSEEEIIRGRLSGMLFNGYTADDVIITVNEEITDSEGGSSDMGDFGSIDLIWAEGVKLDKTTGSEGSDVQYAASQVIDLVAGYAYTARQSNVDGWTTGGISICYYGEGGSYLGYEELWSSVNEERTKNFTPPDGTVSFRVRLFRGATDFVPERYSVTYEKTA